MCDARNSLTALLQDEWEMYYSVERFSKFVERHV